ncbi:hypothetical protein [Streptomyces sp. A1136]|uniref:hypothetical protein n=1 Tax=Streptomyces sp. A1136 TaxID=2563102 RepID=UPI00109E4D4E|nr:hypothetical protein [Streptomyces sp. A1136]THA53198.1 hypothetical protein E6R62_19070 [Streptomyces sp. A1136]
MSSADVVWGGQWEHPACGASGEAMWEDETTVDSGHDCGREGAVVWSAEWRCHGCSDEGDDQFEDDSPAYADHECAAEAEEAAA